MTRQPQPQLKASLGLGSVVLFGLAYLTPMIVLGTWGPMAATSQGSLTSTNVMPYLLDCVRVYATLGEICGAMRAVLGTYEEASVS